MNSENTLETYDILLNISEIFSDISSSILLNLKLWSGPFHIVPPSGSVRPWLQPSRAHILGTVEG